MYGVCVGVLLGGLAQLGMQLPSLFRLGFRFRWKLNLRDPRLRELWTLMWPSVIAGSLTQVNVLVNGAFASEINGGRSWLNCAFRLMYLPIGLFGVSLATVTLPAVARSFARDELGAVRPHREELAAADAVPQHPGRGGPDGAGQADHRADLPARPLHRPRHRDDRAGAAGLRDRAGRLRRDPAADALLLRARPAADADAHRADRHRREPGARTSST